MIKEKIYKIIEDIDVDGHRFIYEEYKVENRVLKVIGTTAKFELTLLNDPRLAEDPISTLLGEELLHAVVLTMCGPQGSGSYQVDPRPSCQFQTPSLSQCRYQCGPYMSLVQTQAGRVRIYPPCHGTNNSACITNEVCAHCGCVMLKARGCRPALASQMVRATTYSVLDTTETSLQFNILEILLRHNNSFHSLAYASLNQTVSKAPDDILYIYLRLEIEGQYNPNAQFWSGPSGAT